MNTPKIDSLKAKPKKTHLTTLYNMIYGEGKFVRSMPDTTNDSWSRKAIQFEKFEDPGASYDFFTNYLYNQEKLLELF